MSKFLKNVIIIASSIVVILFIFQKINILPSFKSFFSSKPVLIEETPILIKEIRTLAQLMTITFTEEIVMDSIKPGFGIPSLIPVLGGSTILPSSDKLVLIGRGKVIAGIDLSKLTEKDISQAGDSIHLNLPGSTILETIINPSDFETFIEKGKWNEAAVTALKVKIRNEIRDRAIKQKILTQSDIRSKRILDTFLRNLGFTRVEIQVES